MSKQQIMKALRKSAAWKQMSAQERVQVNAMSQQAMAQLARSLGVSQGQQRKSSKGRKSSKVTAAMKRSRKIAAAIKAGKVSVRQGKKSAAQMQGKTAKKKAAAFAKLYKGIRVSEGRKSKKGARKSVKKTYAQMQGQKHPYFLQKGFISRVGGGPSGPGVIRAIPGVGAKAFAKLSEAQQQSVVTFLDSEKGKKLRQGTRKSARAAKSARGTMIGAGMRQRVSAQRKSRKSKSRSSRSRAAK